MTFVSRVIRRWIRPNDAPPAYDARWLSSILATLSDHLDAQAAPASRGWDPAAHSVLRTAFGNATVTSASTVSAGSNPIVVSAASGTQNAVPWVIAANTVLRIDPGVAAKDEYVMVTAVSGTTLTATFANAHDGSGTPFSVSVPVPGPQQMDLLNTLVNDMVNRGFLGGGPTSSGSTN